MTIEEDIKNVEDEIRKTPYNKATSHHIGRLKAKLARLKNELQMRALSKSGSGDGYGIKKSGHATIVMAGFPSAGKSTLLNRLTGTNAEVADYDFTTLEVIPGTLEYKGAQIQILDVPGLIQGAAAGRGRGREVFSVMRNADLILLIVDVFQPQQYDILVKELYDAGIRINTTPPGVIIPKLGKDKGGIVINRTVKQDGDSDIDEKMIRAVLSEYKIHNADIIIRKSITLDELIDAIIGNRKYVPAITLMNKIDLADSLTISACQERFPDAVLVSASAGINIDALKERIYNELRFMRVYMKPCGAAPDMNNPLVIKRGSMVADICSAVHRDFIAKFQYARIWGGSAKYAGQRVGLSHILTDGDVVNIVMWK